MSIDKYMNLKNGCPVSIQDTGDYKINAGEMNPSIIRRFYDLLRNINLIPVVWEPFAGTSFKGSSHSSVAHDMASESGIRLISFGLQPKDGRIIQRDSVNNGPGEIVNGMLFHPPYFGSSPMSEENNDLSCIDNEAGYMDKLSKVIDNGVDCISDDGLVCAVGRDYRHRGKRIRLDLWYLELFEKKGFLLKQVWISSPDIVLLFELAA